MSQMMATTINPWALPSLPLESRSKLPNAPGIYFAMFGDQILYIGKAAASIRNRWSAHHRVADLSSVGNVEIAWVEVPQGHEGLSRLERDLINVFNPVLNDGPVFSAPTRSEQIKPPSSWSEKVASNGCVITFLGEAALSELICDKELARVIGGAWFPEHVAKWMIGPCYDDYCHSDTRQCERAQKQSRQNWLAYVENARVIAAREGITVEEALSRIADGTLKP